MGTNQEMNGLPYYKAYPRDFIEGTIGMPLELKGAYRIVLDLIYMQGGELPDDSRYISGLLNCSMRKWASLRNQLIELGKLQVSGEFLTNYRAISELETLSKLQDKQRENRSKSNKNKDLQKPWSDHTEPEPDTDIREERDLASSTPSAADKVGSPSPPLPIEDAVYNYNLIADEFKLPKLVHLTEPRRKKLRARLKEVGLSGWNEALRNVAASDFLRGANGRNWSVTFDWLLSPTNLAKVRENTYANDRGMANGGYGH